MKRLRDVTLGQIADTLVKYRPFLVTVVAVLLIVLVLPARSGHSNVAGGGGGLTTINPVGQAPGGSSGPAGSLGSAGGGGSTLATAAPAGAGTGASGGAGSSPGATGAGSAAGGTGTGTGGSYATGPEVVPAGRYGAASVGTPAALDSANCNAALGQIKMPTIYAPPCVAPFPRGAGNGGATAQGVTASTIKIVLYVPANTAQTAALNGVGLTEPASDQVAQVQGAVQLLEHHVELYGRKIQIIPFTSSVTGTGDTATAEARADAIQVATQIKPFATFGIGAVINWYDLDVAQRGVVDLSEYNWDDSTLQQVSPYLWSFYDNDHIFSALSSYLSKRVWGHKAEYAGSPLYTTQVRKIGMIYGTATFTSADVARLNRDLAAYGIRFADEVGIDDSDPTTAAQQAQTAITRLQADRDTTVVPLSGLFGLLAMAPAATKQGYFPEWVVNPIGYADADQVAQLMDQTQWKHAFGMTSVFPVVNPITADQNGVGLWEWQYHANPPGTYTYVYLAVQDLMKIVTGLELAGPDLTPSTFRAGMFDAPPRGGAYIGGAATVATAFGSHGVWPTPSYSAEDDYTEIYWSGTTSCVSQDGQTQHGCYLYPRQGKRYLWNQWPVGEPVLFRFLPTDITSFSGGEPANERAPNYPEQNYY